MLALEIGRPLRPVSVPAPTMKELTMSRALVSLLIKRDKMEERYRIGLMKETHSIVNHLDLHMPGLKTLSVNCQSSRSQPLRKPLMVSFNHTEECPTKPFHVNVAQEESETVA